MSDVLIIQSVSKHYGPSGAGVQALADVSLTLSAGELVAVQGPSGSGKSTLLMIAAGLLAPSAGSVTLCGQDLLAMAPAERAQARARHIGFVFQQFHLIPYLSALDNVLAAAIPTPSADAADRARELLTRFGLADRLDHVPAKMSIGERQRTALARAMLNNPAVILADEPTGNLDPENADQVIAALRQFTAAGGAVLLVTHHDASAAAASRSVRLTAGRVGQPAGTTT